MDTRDNDQDISCERHEHICHQPKKVSKSGTWVCDKARNHSDKVKKASSAKMQHTRRNHGKHVMCANSGHE